MIRIVLILCLIYVIEINAKRHRCVDTNVPFSEKISRSPIVVYGRSSAKTTVLNTKTELLFDVTFHVDCIFKGNNIEQEIQITEVGIKAGRTACQSLEPGSYYIVFLETLGTNQTVYGPVDFHEVIFDETTNELLEKTCQLTRIPPLKSMINECPNVSTREHCPYDENDVSVTSSEEYSNYVNSDDNKKVNRQSDVIVTKDGSIIANSDNQSKNNACLSTINLFAMIMIMFLKITYNDFEMFNTNQDDLYSY